MLLTLRRAVRTPGVYSAAVQRAGEVIQVLAPCLSDAAISVDLRVKYLAERTVQRLIEGPAAPASVSAQMQTFLATNNAAASFGAERVFVRDFVARVSSRVTGYDSDDEAADDDDEAGGGADSRELAF